MPSGEAGDEHRQPGRKQRRKRDGQRATETIVRAATFGPDDPTGAFLSQNGPLPW